MFAEKAEELKEVDTSNKEDLVTSRLRKNRRDGNSFRIKAGNVLNRKHRPTSFLRNDEAILFYYRSSLCFQQIGHWQDAAESLVSCAMLLKRLALHEEAGATYSEAAGFYQRCDLEEASRVYQLSVASFCDSGRYDIAGKIQYIIGGIQYRNRHWEDAIVHYQKAYTYLKAEQFLDLSAVCQEKISHCHLELGNHAAAFDAYLECARSCAGSNLKRFNAKDYFLKCIFCDFATPLKASNGSELKYLKILKRNSEFESYDCSWRTSKESLFVKNVVEACIALDMDTFADQLYYWNNVKPLDRYSLQMLEVARNDIDTGILLIKEKEAAEIQRQAEEEDRKKKALERLEELRLLKQSPLTHEELVV